MMTPASYDHGQVESNIVYFLTHFVRTKSLGEVLSSDTGFLLARNPDTVRCADGSFVSRDRMNPDGRRGPFYPGAPDLAIEVISPSDRAGEIEEKLRDWLTHGSRVVWLINPMAKLVTVYRGLSDIRVLTAADHLVEIELLPGFELPVQQIFESSGGA